jgi:predicted ribosome quality control (RQC) complex YloA/Tae2 family protein
MQLHYFILRRIAAHLQQEMKGGIFAEAFTQEKDQIMIGLCNPERTLWLRVSCGPPLPYVWPGSQFAKARRNVGPIFPQVNGLRIQRVACVPYERVLLIDLERNFQVALKMHGLMSNVLLLQAGVVVDRFRQHSEADLEFRVQPGVFDEAAVSSAECSTLPVAEHLRAVSPMLDKHFAAYVERKMAEGMDFGAAFHCCMEAAGEDRYYLLRRPGRIQFMLFETGGGEEVAVDGFLPALDIFLKTFHRYEGYARIHEGIRKPLERHIGRLRGQIDSFRTSMDTIAHERPPEEIGHLLMANLHRVPQGAEEVELDDFYHGNRVVVGLKPELNGQQNAERYYQKQKKHRSKARHLEEQIQGLEQQLAALQEVGERFAEFPSPQSLPLTADGLDPGLMKRMNAFGTEYLPLVESGKAAGEPQKHGFMEFRKDGHTILVGRNAKQNDALTFAFSRKDDLWLHARDVAGSHVIVRNPTAGPIPGPVLEYAAGLAAHYSKRKHESLVPVSYTERKYVRKVKNGAAGQVMIDRERVVMVEPVAQ